MPASSWCERATRLVETLLTPGGPTALRTWRPFSLASFRLVHGLAREAPPFRLVIDVGANIGQFSRAAIGVWPGAEIVAFEPLPGAAERLRATLRGAGHADRLEVHACALGAQDGTTEFFPPANSLSSSILAVADGVRQEPWARELEPVSVPLRRLDSVLGDRELARPSLLKLDVQGAELDVLAGAHTVLRQVDALVVETAFEPLYDGQAPFPAVHDALGRLGWALRRPLDMRREGDGRFVEADLLYRRPSG